MVQKFFNSFLLIHFLCSLVNALELRSLDCSYNIEEFFLVVGYKYNCKANNDLLITSSNSTHIDLINGTHSHGHSKEDEIYFYARDRTINYFPSGLERFLPNLKGIAIWHSGLMEIHKSDLQPHSKLTYLSLPYNQIQIIEDDLFAFNSNMEMIFFQENQIFFIGSAVFDNLSGLVTLNFKGNSCIDKDSKYNRNEVMDIIKNVKDQCTIEEISRLENMLKSLEESSKTVKFETFLDFREKIGNFEAVLGKSNFSSYRPLKERFSATTDWKLQVVLVRSKLEELEKSTKNLIKIQSENLNDQLTNLETRLTDKIDVRIENLENSMIDSMTKILINSTEVINSAQNLTLNDKIYNLENLFLIRTSEKIEKLQDNLTDSMNKMSTKSSIDNRRNGSFEDKLTSIEKLLSAKIDKKIEKLQITLTNSMTHGLKQIEMSLRTIHSNIKDEFEVTNYRVVESSQINGIWKSTLVASCTFLVSVILFIAYQKFLFRSMTWNEDD